jgi:hypothetical protein
MPHSGSPTILKSTILKSTILKWLRGANYSQVASRCKQLFSSGFAVQTR